MKEREGWAARLRELDGAIEALRASAPAVAAARRLAELLRERDELLRWLRELDFGRELGGPQEAAPEPPPVAVMLPLRIETRFDPGKLRVRVIPDDPWRDQHDPRASAGELAALERAVAASTAATTDEEQRLAFGELAGQVGGGARAVWLTRTFVGADAQGARVILRPHDSALRTEPAFPRIFGLPEKLHVWLARGGGAPALALTLAVDRDRLSLEPPDRSAGERRWWEDWDEAVAAGLAGTIALDGDPNDIDLLLVTGLSEKDPAELFIDHRDAGSLGVLAPGTPTNTVDGAPGGSLAAGADEWWDVLQAPPGEGERTVSLALTGDPDRLGNLPGEDEPHRRYGQSIVAGLWPALWGFAGEDVWAVVPGAAAASAWAPHALLPEGPFPTVRVAGQPYGLLPATTLARWRPGEQDPDVEAGLLEPLGRLRDLWQRAAEERGTVVGGDTDRLLELLAHVPTAPGYRHRRALPLELWWLVLALLGLGGAWEELDDAWHARYKLADRLGLDPARRYGTRAPSRRLELPLVRPAKLPEERRVGEVIELLIEAAFEEPRAFSRPELLERELVRDPLDSLLLRLVIRSLQVALGDVGRELIGEPPPRPELVWRSAGTDGRLEGWIARLTPADVAAATPATDALRRVVEGLVSISDIPEERLERLLRATLDTAIYRLDPWLLALPVRRLQDLLDAGAPLRLGAYGWVDGPHPGTPGPTTAGWIHAPSPAQARTAAVLRDRAVSDPEADRWQMDLTGRSVRAANRVAEHVRVGAHAGEALGREVERVVAARADVERLRREFPLRTEDAGGRTCDGLAVLAADPPALGLDAPVLAELDELRAAVDAYGDLLVAEAVHHVTQGRPEAAGAAMDAAAGLSRPPQLEVLRTAREGHSVNTSVLVLLQDMPDPSLPAVQLHRAELSPALLADPSAAAFVAAQVGSASAWQWTARTAEEATTNVTLAALGLDPVDALSLPLADLERLVAESAAAALGVGRDDVELSASPGSEDYERAARLVALLGRQPAGPDAIATDPEVAAGGAEAAAVAADLAARYTRVRATAELLAQLLADELALTVDGALGAADAATLGRLLAAARRWGIAPDVRPDAVADPLVAAAERAHELISARLGPAPATPPSGAELLDALTGLVSPTGQLAVLSRLSVSELPGLKREALDEVWLPVVAAVRERLARLEVHQLAAGTPAGSGPALTAWSSKPGDPWQQDPGDPSRLVVTYAAGALDVAAIPVSGTVAAGVVDRLTEVIPSAEQQTGAVFGFDAPAARAQQAILLAVPPDLEAALDDETLRDIVAETRTLAHARMARPDDLGEALRGLLPSVLLPADGPTGVPIE